MYLFLCWASNIKIDALQSTTVYYLLTLQDCFLKLHAYVLTLLDHRRVGLLTNIHTSTFTDHLIYNS